MSDHLYSREAIAARARPHLKPVPVQDNIKALIRTTFNLLESRPYKIYPVDAKPHSAAEAKTISIVREAALRFRDLNAAAEPAYRSLSLCKAAHHAFAPKNDDLCLGPLVIPRVLYVPKITAWQALRSDPAIAVPLYAGKNQGEFYRADGRTFTA
jgi:hypothetical protein